MRIKDTVLNKGLILFAGFLVLLMFWWLDRDYIKKENVPKEIDIENIEELKSSVGEYVSINNACVYDDYVEHEKGSDLTEYYAFYSCDLIKQDSTHLIGVLKNDWGLLFLDRIALENGDVDFFEGELLESSYLDSGVKSVFKDLGVSYSDENCFRLNIGKTPKRAILKLIQKEVIVCLIVIIYILHLRSKKHEIRHLHKFNN